MERLLSRKLVVFVLIGNALFGCSDELDETPTIPYPSFAVRDLVWDISPDNAWVVYTHGASSDLPAGIYKLNLLSLEKEFLMPVSLGDFDPIDLRISPDGRRIAMVRWGKYDIYVLDTADLSITRTTFTEGNAWTPDWDPSGRYIVYVRPFWNPSSGDSSAGLYIVDTGTLVDTQFLLNGSPFGGLTPRWSPDSSKIASALGAEVGQRITALHLFGLAIDGSWSEDLMPADRRWNSMPEWFGGSERLIFNSATDASLASYDTRVVDLQTGDIEVWPVNLWKYRITQAAISRDGQWFVYTDADSSGLWGVLYSQRSDDVTGASRRQLTWYTPPVSLGDQDDLSNRQIPTSYWRRM